MRHTDLSIYNNSWYKPGGTALKRLLWYFCNILVLLNPLLPINGLKVWMLRLFGARIGVGVVIKPQVNIKYPWHLHIGNHVWIGENVWIDNLTTVSIGNHVCISQGAMLLTGSHNYKKSTFDLITGPITLEDGVWIGAKALVCPNVTCGSHSVLAAQSVATAHLEAWQVYQGNPATSKRIRKITE
jgi:putative colanic acid biosynthesis acetyltransferase WcaF